MLAALDHVALGRLLDARPAPGGLFGQNVLLDTTEGGFVLRGYPHPGGQLSCERYFARCLHEQTDAGWRVSGVLDLMTAEVSDGEMDLSRAVAYYADRGPAPLDAFLRPYLAQHPPRPGFAERFAVYTLLDRLILWNYGQRNHIWFEKGISFREWAEPYTSRVVL